MADFPGDPPVSLHDLLMAYNGSDQPYRAPSSSGDIAPDAQPGERGMLLPVMRQGDTVSPAVPRILHDPYEILQRFISSRYSPGARDGSNDEAIQASANLAGTLAASGAGRSVAAAAPRALRPLPDHATTADNGIGQNIYEALLGRTREPGEDVAQPGSGWWKILGQPIPKPTNVLPWAGVGGIGYAGYKGEQNLMDDYGNSVRNGNAPWGPLTWLHQKIGSKPFTPDELANFTAGHNASLAAFDKERKDANRLGAAQPNRFDDWLGTPLHREEEAAMSRQRLPGGVGNEPY